MIGACKLHPEAVLIAYTAMRVALVPLKVCEIDTGTGIEVGEEQQSSTECVSSLPLGSAAQKTLSRELYHFLLLNFGYTLLSQKSPPRALRSHFQTPSSTKALELRTRSFPHNSTQQ